MKKSITIQHLCSFGARDLFLALIAFGIFYKYWTILSDVTGTKHWYVIGFRIGCPILFFGAVASLVAACPWGRISFLVFSALTAFGTLVMVIYYRYNGDILTLYDLFLVGEAAEVSGIAIREIITAKDLLFFLDTAALSVFLLLAWKRRLNFEPSRQAIVSWGKINWRINVGVPVLVISVLLYSLPFFVYRNFSRARNGGVGFFVHIHGLGSYFAYDAYNYFKKKKDAENIVLHFPDRPDGQKTSLTEDLPAYPSANVIIIQVESLNANLIGYTHNGVEVTPFLNAMAKNNINCLRHFALHTRGSVDSDAALLTGAFPVPYRTLFTYVDLSKYPSLARVMAANGYDTAFFHSNRGNFYDRKNACEKLGFGNCYFREHYSGRKDVKVEWGINDEDFFSISAETIAGMTRPFFAYLITITSHLPYDWDIKNRTIKAFDDIEEEQLRGYFNSIHFTDQAIGAFVQQLEALSRDNIIVVVGDHDSPLESQTYRVQTYLPDDEACDQNHIYPAHVPMIVRTPDRRQASIDKYTIHVDLAPTVLAMTGMPVPEKTLFGNSIFSSYQTPMVFDANKNIYFLFNGYVYRRDDNGFFLPCRKTVWSKEGPPMPIPPEMQNYANAVITYSRDMSKKFQ